jgi:WD40 repeat protein
VTGAVTAPVPRAPGASWSFTTVFGRVMAVATATVDGRVIAVTAGDDGRVRRWDLTTGEPIGRPMTGHTQATQAVATAVLPDGRTVAVTGGDDELVWRWDLGTGQPIGDPLTGHRGPVRAVATAVLPDGRRIAVTGGEDGLVRRWDLTTGRPVDDPLTGHAGPVWAVATAVLPDGRTIVVSGSGGGRVRRWDLTTGQPIGDPLTGHNGPVRALATAALTDGRAIAVSAGNDGTVRRWDLTTGQPIDDPLTGHSGRVLVVATAVLPDGRTIAVTGGGSVRRWDLTTGEPIGDPLTGHKWTVPALAAATLPDGRVIAVSGSGTMRRWDLTTGQPIGDPLIGHSAQVRAVATAVLGDGRAIAVTGSDDRTVRRWDLTTGQPVGGPLTGHSAQVLAVATVVLPDGRTIAVSGGGATMWRWDLATGQSIGEAAIAHPGSVQAMATASLPDGRIVAVTGGDDGAVRRWDLASGQAVGDPLTGHSYLLPAMATATPPNGRAIAVSGGLDGTVRRWDLATGEPIGDPLTGHTQPVWAVATAVLPDGRTIAVSGSGDETVRCWDLGTGQPIGDPLASGGGAVRAVAAAVLPDGRTIAVTGGDDGAVQLWDVVAGSQIVAVPAHRGGVTCAVLTLLPGSAGGMLVTAGHDGLLRVWDVAALVEMHAIGLEEVFAGENTGAADRLSRAGLASHVAGRLRQLTTAERSASPATGDPTGSGIVHLDGRWGAGKTTLVELMLREPAAELGDPVVVRYDAWRNAAIAPEWWSIAAEVRRAVHRSRAAPTRLVLTLAAYARRLARSTSTWVALLVVAAAGVAGRWLVTGPRGMPQQFTAVLGLVTSVSGVLAVAFVVARGLFWSAPVLGRLHMRTDDNPLAEISGIVGQLRRWTPREGVPHRLIDWAFAVWLAGCVSLAVWWEPVITWWRQTPEDTRTQVARAADIVLLIGLCVIVLGRRAPSRTPPAAARRLFPNSTVVRRVLDRARTHRVRLGVAAAAIVAAGWLSAPLWSHAWAWWQAHIDPATGFWIAAAAAGLLAYPVVLAATTTRRRRMLLLVIDDLDRCDGERVVRLLETIHTMLRERSAPQRLRRWRDPAPFAVIVSASGRWIRDAFAKHYDIFDRHAADDDAVHDLGADFLQKIFDHSVLVPGLSPEQTEDLIHTVSGSRYRPTTPHRLRRPAFASTSDDSRPLLTGPAGTGAEAGPAPQTSSARVSASTGPMDPAAAEPSATPGPPASTADETTTGRLIERAGADARAAQSDLGTNASLLITHLLTNYSSILPRNPRLIIRVASAWAMLRAVARSLDLEADAEPANELLVRAAVIWVRFPALVDDLLDADRGPVIDPARAECPPKWRRRDVQQVLTMDGGRRLDIDELALYYGKYFTGPG